MTSIRESAGDKAVQTSKFSERRGAIMRSAALLFNERGIKGATLADVAEAVDLNLKSLRYYFSRKNDLVAECFLTAIAAYAQMIRAAEGGATRTERLGLYLDAYFDRRRRIVSGDESPLLHFGGLRALDGEHLRRVAAAYGAMFYDLSRLLGEQAGPAKRESDSIAHLVLSQLLWAVVWTGRHEPERLARASARMLDILIGGLAAPGVPWAPAVIDVASLAPASPEAPREAFLRAATKLINEQGYRGASVEKISASLSVTKGSFYHHIDAKDDLVVQCFERTFDVMRQAKRVADAMGGSGFQRLVNATTLLIRFQFSEGGPLLRTAALSAVPREISYDLTRRMDRVTASFSDLISDGVIDGSIRPVDTNIGAQMINGMINATEELWYWLPGVTADEAVDACARRMFMGLFSEPEARTP